MKCILTDLGKVAWRARVAFLHCDATRSRSTRHRATFFHNRTMVRGIEGNEMSSKKAKQATPASTGQRTLMGFFKPAGPASSPTPVLQKPKAPASSIPTPSPSIDAAELPSSSSASISAVAIVNKENGASPSTRSATFADHTAKEGPGDSFSSPSRRVRHDPLLARVVF